MKCAALRRSGLILALIIAVAGCLAVAPAYSSGSADLWQARNGTPSAPNSPVEWARGNASPANSHYVEGNSIPYRMVMTGLTNGPHRLVIEWDTRQGGKHAVDFITHYDLLVPHVQFGDHTTPEIINPLDGLTGPFGSANVFPIPTPMPPGSPLPGYPAAGFQSLPGAQRMMTIWNGTIIGLSYLLEEPLTNVSASTRMAVDFLADGETVVIAWGGHIATKLVWGVGNSATSIGGAPYHMRKIEFDGSGGNQDRSVQALAVASPPSSVVSGPAFVCALRTNRFVTTTDTTDPATLFQWTIVENTAGAVIVGPTNMAQVDVVAASEGSFVLEATVSMSSMKGSGRITVAVGSAISLELLDPQTVCPRSAVTFRAELSGTAPIAFVWSRDGHPINGATNRELALANVTHGDAGLYCVEASNGCGATSVCALLAVKPDPVLSGPPDLQRECWADVPPPDPTSVTVIAGAPPVTVIHAGDTTVTNGGSILITRSYEATDACGSQATWLQTIGVRDLTPPALVCPADAVVPCTGPEGATMAFAASASDACDGRVAVICVPSSGSLFPLGRTVVKCGAIDASGNEGECSFSVTVVDLEPPVIHCPQDLAVLEDPEGSGQALVRYLLPTATDNADLNPVVSCSPPPGSPFSLGNTTVRCTATDASSNSGACSFQVRVVPRVIVANSTADSGPGTLRQALLDANAAPGSNVIAFAFPGTPPFVIQLLSPLPDIVDSVAIDGWSQLEFRGLPIVELEGSNMTARALPSAGLTITTGNTEVRGLALHGFVVGLRVAGPGGNIIQGNFIGTDAAGAASPGNSGDGLQIESPGNQIGGDTPAARNVISGNLGHGIVFDGPYAVSNVVRGNWIGPVGEEPSPLGNGGNGIVMRGGASHNPIGPDNVVAFNHLSGVLLEASAGNGNAIRANRIFANGALGIDLGDDGPTPDDPGDADEGPNQLQNRPALTLARATQESSVVEGSLNSAAHRVFAIDFFLSRDLNAVGNGEGAQFLGSTTAQTDGTGQGNVFLTLPFRVPIGQFVTATATDDQDNTSEFSLVALVDGPPVILIQPVGVAVPPGSSVTFCVTAEGSPPLTYQWRLNGANIPGATNTCLTVPNAQLESGGSYTVAVANDLGAVVSEAAVLSLIFPLLQAGDNFIEATPLPDNSGLVSGNNRDATFEPGEPNHANKPGGKSVWYAWRAPATGVATFSAMGSAFDTLLAVYTGSSVSTLTNVVADEDRGGFFTSFLQFNAFSGQQYWIAIDGYGAASGEFVFSWSFTATAALLPVIFDTPRSQTVVSGSTVTFQVDASVDCRDPHYSCRRVSRDQPPDHPGERDPLTYQWLFNGAPIPGATGSSLTVTNVQAGTVGVYTVLVTGNGPALETQPAILQINETEPGAQRVQATDKFLDALYAEPLRLGDATATFAPAADPENPFVAAVAVRSYTSTQVFSSLGGTTSAGELLPCYGVGGASEWYGVVAEQSGSMYVDTDGSSYDTVLAVYGYSPTSGLTLLACDNNSGRDGRDSALNFVAQAGRTNFIVLDGYNGASGVATLHCTLVTPGALRSLGMTNRVFGLRLSGQPAMRFTLQKSSNLVNWVSLLTTNSATGTFDFTDKGATNAPRQFYRALMLP